MPPLAEIVPAAALVALLVTAYAHPRGRTEAAVGLAAAGGDPGDRRPRRGRAAEEVRHLGPVVIFLVTILVVGDVCGRAGVFAAAAGWVRRLGPRPSRPPVHRRVPARGPGDHHALPRRHGRAAHARRARGGRGGRRLGAARRPRLPADGQLRLLLLPVSNLTNLLAMRYVGLTFVGLRRGDGAGAGRGARHRVRRRAAAVPPRADRGGRPRARGARTARRCRASRWSRSRRCSSASPSRRRSASSRSGSPAPRPSSCSRGPADGPRHPGQAVHAGHPAFAVFVLCLGVVVAALAVGPLGDRVRDLLPDGTSYGALPADRGAGHRAGQPADEPLGHAPARADAGAARHDRRARGAARAQHRLRADLHRVAGEPAVAPDPGAARPAAHDVGVPPGLAGRDAGQRCWER